MTPRQPLHRLLGILLLIALALGSALSAAHHHDGVTPEPPVCEGCILGTLQHGAAPAPPVLTISPLPTSVSGGNPASVFVAAPRRLFAARAPPVHSE